MRDTLIRTIGLIAAVLYASLIVWLHVAQPRTMAQVTGGLASSIGAYRVDAQSFQDGLDFFKRDQFAESRAAFARADPAERDARTQFYIAYSYYRQGWGRVSSDDELFAKGLAAVDKAIALAPGGRLVVDDPQLLMHSADELRAELQRGLTTEADDFNPLRLMRPRK